ARGADRPRSWRTSCRGPKNGAAQTEFVLRTATPKSGRRARQGAIRRRALWSIHDDFRAFMVHVSHLTYLYSNPVENVFIASRGVFGCPDQSASSRGRVRDVSCAMRRNGYPESPRHPAGILRRIHE